MSTFYHNPRCSKSREALQLLRDKGIEPEVVLYLETPPDAAALQALLKKLKLKPRELMRQKEPEYKELGLDDASLSDAELIAALTRCPKLIERPILVKGNKAIIGRPPELVLEIL
ncbi:MAG TPA: arsenate reductase (glutaredoxin) [Dongiaceae bacterium]|nr:arsenate reductase (glutaredoxin) [Dongiaceae bacterium]